MFPFFETRAAWDDYGEVINPDDYIIKEEDKDQSSMQVSLNRKEITQVICNVEIIRCITMCFSLVLNVVFMSFTLFLLKEHVHGANVFS